MYSLIALFFSIPLYFSHIFSPIGVIIGDSSSFERQKVYLFGLLIVIAFFEMLITQGGKFLLFLKKYGAYALFLILFPLISAYWWGLSLDAHFFLGSTEKHHGYIWYSLFLVLVFLLLILTNGEKQLLIRATIFASITVAFFAILEYILGFSVFFPHVIEAPWGEARAVSTLGNPNYVAGFLLLSLPLFSTIRSPERWVYMTLVGFAIFTTGSYIGIGLGLIYIAYLVLRSLFGLSMALCAALCSMVGMAWLTFSFVPHEKLLSLESRFVLMREIWTVMVSYPLSFVFGFGPESIISYFDGARSAIIDSYFPLSSAIDSSHNIFLDFLFQYGILPLSITALCIWRSWKNLTREAQEGLVLGLVFLSLNVVVTSHIILLVLLANFSKNQK